MKEYFLIFLTLTALFFSCTNRSQNGALEPGRDEKPLQRSLSHDSTRPTATLNVGYIRTGNDSFLSNDAAFINQEILKGRFKVELERYDTIRRGHCAPDRLSKKTAVQEFEGFKNVGDLDNDGRGDYVFVLAPINRCEEGQSYYFSNPKIPRIATDSYCCHPESIFSIGDIDEDGSNELAQYYSSCASRYKAITVWTLKKNAWKEVETFSYVLNEEYKEFEDFDKLAQKVARNKFRFLEIKDVTVHGALVKEWRTIIMK